jgi:restriction endonuclease S subunit
MAIFSIVKLSELEGAKRLDAEYYKPEYLEIIDILTIKKAKPLIKLATDVICGPFGSSILERDYRPEGVPLIRVSDTADLFIKDDDLVFIDDSLSEKMKRYQVFPGDLVVSQRGTIAMFSLVTRKFSKWNISANLISIKKSNKINFNYLLIFLNSFYGASQLFRKQSGEVQPKITTDDVKQLLVFVANSDIQEKVSDLVELAYKEKEISYSLYSQAESLLLEELGLKDFKPKYEKTYTAKLSDAFSAHRIDAEYFQPAYEEIIEKLRENNIELQPLRKFILSIQKGIEPGSENYRDEGKPFIRVSNLSKYGFTDRDQKYLSEELYQQLRETYEPKQGDFLLTKDATPGIAYVVKEQIEGIISSGILRLQINDNEINKEYLALCINSIVGKMQVERDCGGSVILHWKPEQVKRLQIPILPLSIQQEIASLVQQSHEARRKAKELLELAKRAVEIAIEEGEEKAINFLSRIK